jgi:uncharacterized membrane protein
MSWWVDRVPDWPGNGVDAVDSIPGEAPPIIRSMEAASRSVTPVAGYEVRAFRHRAAACAAVAIGLVTCVAAGWHSPVRVVLAILMIVVVPGEAVAMALAIRDSVEELVVAVGGSLSLSALVSVTLLYLHVWTLALATGILIAVSAGGIAVAAVRTRSVTAVAGEGER